VNGALDQFRKTEEWRKANQLEALYENFDVDSYEEARRVVSQHLNALLPICITLHLHFPHLPWY
jgi:hypothetical protein